MRRMNPAVCVLAIGSLVLAAGCKPNLRVAGPVTRTRVGSDVGVKAVIENDSRGDADDAFVVSFRRLEPTPGPWQDVPFAHGLAKHKTREIKALVPNVPPLKKIAVVVDRGDAVRESNEGDNERIFQAPP